MTTLEMPDDVAVVTAEPCSECGRFHGDCIEPHGYHEIPGPVMMRLCDHHSCGIGLNIFHPKELDFNETHNWFSVRADIHGSAEVTLPLESWRALVPALTAMIERVDRERTLAAVEVDLEGAAKAA